MGDSRNKLHDFDNDCPVDYVADAKGVKEAIRVLGMLSYGALLACSTVLTPHVGFSKIKSMSHMQ